MGQSSQDQSSFPVKWTFVEQCWGRSRTGYAEHKSVISSVRHSGNARTRLGVAAIRVEATDSIATVIHEGAAQGGYAEEERQ
ncbi:hypothetical protein GOBAR_AA22710 [Gossypium barbadense]|uniref:Uncharacterized protein n=1 Tax=Gossypium barbadense TaxID=3634 RepID=A0A2P5X3N8_GOSBA|nr:hypothetical protein GOBAR_AA22710 [Gossypium barbadense]